MKHSVKLLFILAIVSAQLAASPVTEGYIETVSNGFNIWLKGPDFEFFGGGDSAHFEAKEVCPHCLPGTVVPLNARIMQFSGYGTYQDITSGMRFYAFEQPLEISAGPVVVAGAGSYSSTFTMSGVITAEQSIIGPWLFDLPLSGYGISTLTVGEGADDLFFIRAEYYFVPEPSTMALLGIGCLALICSRRRLKNRP